MIFSFTILYSDIILLYYLNEHKNYKNICKKRNLEFVTENLPFLFIGCIIFMHSCIGGEKTNVGIII